MRPATSIKKWYVLALEGEYLYVISLDFFQIRIKIYPREAAAGQIVL